MESEPALHLNQNDNFVTKTIQTQEMDQYFTRYTIYLNQANSLAAEPIVSERTGLTLNESVLHID